MISVKRNSGFFSTGLYFHLIFASVSTKALSMKRVNSESNMFRDLHRIVYSTPNLGTIFYCINRYTVSVYTSRGGVESKFCVMIVSEDINSFILSFQFWHQVRFTKYLI